MLIIIAYMTEIQQHTTADYFRSIAAILLFFINLLIATPLVILLSVISIGYLNNFIIEKIGPAISKPVLFVLGISLDIEHKAPLPDQPAVYIINHSSTLDLLIILALGLPRIRFVAKYELQYNPLFFLLGRFTGQVFIVRQKTDKAVKKLQKTYNRIKRQRLSLLMAPEGSRKHEGVIGPFKKGPFRVAMDLELPIVPIFVDGAYQFNEGGSLISKSGTITTTIHQSIDTRYWSLDELEQRIDQIRDLYLQWAHIDEDILE